MICVGVTYVVKPGFEDQAAAIFAIMSNLTRQEPGCRLYQAHRSIADSCRFFLYEQYDDEAALDAHREAPYFETYIRGQLFTMIESRTPETYIPL
jgi:autoinducer 2-degrading protein